MKSLHSLVFGLVAFLSSAVVLSAQAPVDGSFTYQGRLDEAGSPASGVYDLEFNLFDAPVAGSQLGPTISHEDVAIIDGLFVVDLDFGQGVFDGTERWLDIRVREGSGVDPHTLLAPRQELTATPYAGFSERAAVANDLVVGTVTTDKISDAAVTDAKVAPGIDYSKITGGPTTLPPTGPAGGDLDGLYPNPSIRDSRAVKSLNTLRGDVSIQGGDGIDVDDSGQTITIANTGLETTRSWHFNVADLSAPQFGTGGGLSLFDGSDLFTAVPVYEFLEGPPNTLTGGTTSLPLSSELDGGSLTVELFWVVNQDGGNVRWRMNYSSRLAGNRLNEDGDVTVITSVDSTGSDRLYKTSLVLDPGFNSGDELLAFAITRQGSLDTNNGTVSLVAIRFVYDADQ